MHRAHPVDAGVSRTGSCRLGRSSPPVRLAGREGALGHLVDGQEAWSIIANCNAHPLMSHLASPVSVRSIRQFVYARSMMNQDQIVRALSALAHPLRLQVFRALVVVGQSGLTPSAITAGVGVLAATLSFHLKELTNAGLITQERSGRNLIYRAVYEQMNSLLGYLAANCCQGGDCAVEP